MDAAITAIVVSLVALAIALVALWKALSTQRDMHEGLRSQKQLLREMDPRLRALQGNASAGAQPGEGHSPLAAEYKRKTTALWRRHKPYIAMRWCVIERLLSLDPESHYPSVLGEWLKPFLQAMNDLPSEMIASTKEEFNDLLEPGRSYDGTGKRARAILERVKERIDRHIAEMEAQLRELSEAPEQDAS